MLNRAKFLGVVTGLAVLVAACSDSTRSATNTNPPPADNAANVSTTAPAGQKKPTPATDISSLGVKDVSEIKFQTPPPAVLNGFFDAVNNSGALKHNVSKNGTVTLTGWAIIPEKTKAAEKVIITLPDSNQIVAIANVKLARPDVAKAIKNPSYKNSGWTTAFKADSLPTGRVILRAWTYDPTTKTATQLKNIHELTVSE
ncbi:hypothetical protein [Floridanema evergladense]|uniref:Uncharacterized protein n=1 Tax=Floridaenema evergladense BLCC-F167 TaxID=3153639 RepID=A0ABV4WL73_9CYAN